jgi:hypothetical protein
VVKQEILTSKRRAISALVALIAAGRIGFSKLPSRGFGERKDTDSPEQIASAQWLAT